MNPRGLKTRAQPIFLGRRREPIPPEVAMAHDLEVLAARKVPGLFEVEVEDVNARGDMGLFDFDASSIALARRPPILILLALVAACSLPEGRLKRTTDQAEQESSRKEPHAPL